MKQYYIVFLIFSWFVLSGCGGSTQQIEVEQETLPQWYTNPPISNKEYLYAVGEGKGKQEAIANALSDMVATLGVVISSDYNAKTVVKEGLSTSKEATYKNEVRAKVEEIRISNYELLNFKKLGFKRYAVLLRSDKNKLFQSLYEQIRHSFVSIETKDLSSYNALEKLAFYRDALRGLQHLKNRLMVMNGLNPSFDSREFLKRYEALQKRYETLHNAISFTLKATRKARLLIPAISKGLTQKHYTIADKTDKNHFTVFVDIKIDYGDAYGIALAQSKIDIVTRDYRNKIVSANTLNITGQSSNGYKAAQQNVAKKFNKLIDEKGIADVLNLDI